MIGRSSPLTLLRTDPRATALILAGLLATAAAAWYLMFRLAAGMGGMTVMQPGANMTGAVAFLAVWVVMIIAMMFPSIAPMVLAHRLVTRRRGDGWYVSGSFVAGYLLIWAAIGLVPTGGFLTFRDVVAGPLRSWVPDLAGALLVGAGLYQFTSIKRICLKHCRTPLDFLMHHDFGGGTKSAIRAGIAHGAYCVGCCWALMSVLVVVGFMNLAGMAALAAIFVIEKNMPWGVLANRVVGIGLVLLGSAVALRPEVLAVLSGGSGHM